jgi:hypothetical protein
VTRFIDSNEVVVYLNVAIEIPEQSRQRYLALYAQVLQLQKFQNEIEKDEA